MVRLKNKIVPFNFDGVSIRTYTKDFEPWFVTADLAQALGYDHVPHAVRMLDDDEKGVHKVDTPGGKQTLSVCNESWLYHLVLMSKKPEAKRFRKWVTSEVLPSIRKHGKYQENWYALRHAIASSSKVMSGILESVRQQNDKDTAPHHHMCEHKLINSLLTGEYKGLDREVLSLQQLDFLAHFEVRNSILIGLNLPYEERKETLLGEVVVWKRKLPSSNDPIKLAA